MTFGTIKGWIILALLSVAVGIGLKMWRHRL